MIVPSSSQVAPKRRPSNVATREGRPPDKGTLKSLLDSSTQPTHRPSGERKGADRLLPRASSTDSSASSERTISLVPESLTKITREPSGVSAIWLAGASGGSPSLTVSKRRSAGRVHRIPATTPIVAMATAVTAAIAATRQRDVREGKGAAAGEGLAPSSHTRRSPMSRSRRLASFSRQARKTRCSAGPASWGRRSHCGSSRSTDVIVSVTSSPLNARAPVSIS